MNKRLNSIGCCSTPHKSKIFSEEAAAAALGVPVRLLRRVRGAEFAPMVIEGEDGRYVYPAVDVYAFVIAGNNLRGAAVDWRNGAYRRKRGPRKARKVVRP